MNEKPGGSLKTRNSVKAAMNVMQEAFAEYPGLQSVSVRRVDSLRSIEFTTVTDGIEGVQLVRELD